MNEGVNEEYSVAQMLENHQNSSKNTAEQVIPLVTATPLESRFPRLEQIFKKSKHSIIISTLVLIMASGFIIWFYIKDVVFQYELQLFVSRTVVEKFSESSIDLPFLIDEKMISNERVIDFDWQNKGNGIHCFLIKSKTKINLLKDDLLVKVESRWQNWLQDEMQRIRISIEKSNLQWLEQEKVLEKNFYEKKSDRDVDLYLKHSEEELRNRWLYFEKVLLIDRLARHHVLDTHRIRPKEIESPYLKEIQKLLLEIEMKETTVGKDKVDKLREYHEEFLKGLLEKDMEAIPLAELSPTRQQLIELENDLRKIWYDWQVSKGLKDEFFKRIKQNDEDAALPIKLDSWGQSQKAHYGRLMVLEDMVNTKKPYLQSLEWRISEEGARHSKYLIYLLTVGALWLFYGFGIWYWEKKKNVVETIAELSNVLEKKIVCHTDGKELSQNNHSSFIWYDQNFYHRIYHPSIEVTRLKWLVVSEHPSKSLSTKICLSFVQQGSLNQRTLLLTNMMLDELQSVFHSLDRPLSAGFEDFWGGVSLLKDCVYSTDIKNLFVLPRSSKMMMKNGVMNNQMNHIGQYFDLVIVDGRWVSIEDLKKMCMASDQDLCALLPFAMGVDSIRQINYRKKEMTKLNLEWQALAIDHC